LTGGVWQKEARERLDEVPIVEECANLCGNVVAHAVRRCGDIANNLSATVDDRDDVFEIVAREDVPATAPRNASSLVAMNRAGVTIRTRWPATSMVVEVSMASGYHRLLKPSTEASVGMTSTISAPCRHRQSGAPSVVSSTSPIARNLSARAAYLL
jgi:hypothetical protein